jgi:hypothetical protein
VLTYAEFAGSNRIADIENWCEQWVYTYNLLLEQGMDPRPPLASVQTAVRKQMLFELTAWQKNSVEKSVNGITGLSAAAKLKQLQKYEDEMVPIEQMGPLVLIDAILSCYVYEPMSLTMAGGAPIRSVTDVVKRYASMKRMDRTLPPFQMVYQMRVALETALKSRNLYTLYTEGGGKYKKGIAAEIVKALIEDLPSETLKCRYSRTLDEVKRQVFDDVQLEWAEDVDAFLYLLATDLQEAERSKGVVSELFPQGNSQMTDGAYLQKSVTFMNGGL